MRGFEEDPYTHYTTKRGEETRLSKDERALIQGGNTHLGLRMPTSFIILSAMNDAGILPKLAEDQWAKGFLTPRGSDSEENTQ